MIGRGWVRAALACLVFGGILAALAAPVWAEAPGADTPEALVERLKQATEKEDLGEMMACLTPQARGEMAAGMYLAATMVVAFSQMGVEMGGSMADSLSEDATDEQKAEVQAQKEKALAEANKLRDSYNAIVSKYGLPVIPEEGEAEEPTGDPKEIFQNIDQVAFLNEIFAFFEAMPGEEKPAEEKESPVDLGEGVLTDLAIDGDAATAKIDGKDVKFVRIDGRWFFDAEGILGGPGEP